MQMGGGVLLSKYITIKEQILIMFKKSANCKCFKYCPQEYCGQEYCPQKYCVQEYCTHFEQV